MTISVSNLFRNTPKRASLFVAVLIGLAITASPALADERLIGGILACHTFYKSGSTPENFNVSTWTFPNFNNVPIFIQSIRVYDWNGRKFSYYKWNGTGFEQLVTDTEAGLELPSDKNETIGQNDNKLGAYQSFQYYSDALFEAKVLPEHSGYKGTVTLIVKWTSNNELVYPLGGGVTRNKHWISEPSTGELVGELGRSSHNCVMTRKTYMTD